MKCIREKRQHCDIYKPVKRYNFINNGNHGQILKSHYLFVYTLQSCHTPEATKQ